MKHLIFAATAAVGLLFTSCSQKDNVIDTGTRKASYYPQGINNENIKYHYVFEMTAEERYQLWIDKLNYDLTNENFSTSQLALLSDLKQFLRVSYFHDNAEVDQNFEDFIANWRLAASAAGWDFLDQKKILNSCAPYQGNGGDPVHPPVTWDCECSQESDWCFGSCDGINCSHSTRRGCGTFLRYACDGGC